MSWASVVSRFSLKQNIACCHVTGTLSMELCPCGHVGKYSWSLTSHIKVQIQQNSATEHRVRHEVLSPRVFELSLRSGSGHHFCSSCSNNWWRRRRRNNRWRRRRSTSNNCIRKRNRRRRRRRRITRNNANYQFNRCQHWNQECDKCCIRRANLDGILRDVVQQAAVVKSTKKLDMTRVPANYFRSFEGWTENAGTVSPTSS